MAIILSLNSKYIAVKTRLAIPVSGNMTAFSELPQEPRYD